MFLSTFVDRINIFNCRLSDVLFVTEEKQSFVTDIVALKVTIMQINKAYIHIQSKMIIEGTPRNF